ncbi:carbohydrate ABC transporter permease [Haloechinothrix sp. LS1_15]|nr:carbohydrate ABC transporter permease [Haloechinothrix sp. LS1_15]
MLLTALKPHDELFASPTTYLPESWEFGNFIEVWRVAPLWEYLRNTIIIAGLSTVLAVSVALPAAYYTARRRFWGRRGFLLLVLVTQMFAPTALVIGIHREMLALGLIDTHASLILVNAAFNLAFSTWILHAYFTSIPVELEEAAWLDGCGKARALLTVTLPLAVPGVVTAVIFTFITAWNEFVIALTLTSTPDTQPLTVGITAFIGQYEVQWQFLFAASLIAIVPVVILFAFIERFLVSGLTAGSVK